MELGILCSYLISTNFVPYILLLADIGIYFFFGGGVQTKKKCLLQLRMYNA